MRRAFLLPEVLSFFYFLLFILFLLFLLFFFYRLWLAKAEKRMNKKALAHFRRAARYRDEENETKARAHFRRGVRLSERSSFGGRVTLVSSDSIPFVVDVDVANMFDVLREMGIDDSEHVPLPSVDGETLGKALEFCEAHAPSSSMRLDKAWDDAYSAKLPRRMLFRLLVLADKWSCEMLLRVLAKRVVLVMMEEYYNVDALRSAFHIRGDFTKEELEEAAEHSPHLLADVKREAFKWNRDYFFNLQEITFLQAMLRGASDYEREAQRAMARVVTNDWFYTAFLARLRCLRDKRAVSGLASDLLQVRTNVWYVMHVQLCLLDSRVIERGVGRCVRWNMQEQMGLCTCGTPAGEQFIAHGYYDSDTHRDDIAQLMTEEHFRRAPRELRLRPHSTKGLIRYARVGTFTEADTCAHQGQPWTWAINERGNAIPAPGDL